MKKIFCLSLFITVLLTLGAQAPNWLNYTCGKEVHCQAEEGNFIWAGTNGGLVRINKLTSQKTYYTGANSGLRGLSVTGIGIDSQGNKWISTFAGLHKFDGTNWSLTKPAEYSTNFNIRALAIDSQDNVWVGGYFFGLYKYNVSTGWTHYEHVTPDIHIYHVYSLAIDNQDNVWTGSYNRLVKFDGNSWTAYNELYTYTGGIGFDVNFIATDNVGTVWLASDYNGMLKFSGGNWTFFDINNDVIYNEYASALYCDSDNNLWLGATLGSLAKYDGNNWTYYSHYPNSVFPWRVYSILVDSQNHIWTGTEHLYEYNGTDWTMHFTANSPLPEIAQRLIHADNQNNIWLGGSFGLTRISSSVWTNFNSTNSGFPPANAYALDSGPNGNLWCLAYDMSYDSLNVVCFDGTNWTIFNSSNSILTNDIYCLTVDYLNRLWLGTGHGTVVRYDGNAWTELTVPNTIPWATGVIDIGADSQNNIYAFGYWGLARYNGADWTVWQYDVIPVPIGNLLDFYVDNQGNVWIGSKSGLAKFDGTNWSHYNPDNSANPHWFAIAMGSDNLGNLWFRSFDEDTNGCLVKFNGSTWTSFYSYDVPLTDSEINDIACDNYNNVWMATRNGITVYNENGIVANQDEILPDLSLSLFNLNIYPNPFNNKASIGFELDKAELVSLSIYDIKGRLVKRLCNVDKSKGKHTAEWDGIDKSGKTAAAGVYFCRIETKSGRQLKKLVIVK